MTPLAFNPVYVLAHIPEGFVTDCCSSSPDVIFGVSLKPFCRAHDAAGCQRLWPPGTMTLKWRHGADRQLGIEIRAALPWTVRWIGWIYWIAVWQYTHDLMWNRCGPAEGNLCCHGQPRPTWMD